MLRTGTERINSIIWVIALIFALFIGFLSLRYLDFDVKNILEERTEALRTWIYPIGFYSHVIFGPVALITGIFQFNRFFRSRRIEIHRSLGKIYILSCVLAGFAGIVVSFFTFGGWLSTFGFSTLGILWIISTVKAYSLVLSNRVNEHLVWMHRSYALTFAAVSLRIWLGILQGLFGLDFISSYTIVSWLCWVPNLILMEAYIGLTNGLTNIRI